CARIAEQLTAGLDFLSTPLRDVPERHRSLRAVFDDTWCLLTEVEQTALAKLSVFHGTFGLETAEEIGGITLPDLAGLVDKSLIRVDGTDRYALHELLRQYAADQLAQQASLAGHRERAIDYLTRAAMRASDATQQRQAAALLEGAITIAQEGGLTVLLGELHHKRAQALLKVSMWVEARPDLEAALRAPDSHNVDRQVQILLELADVDFALHNLAAMREHVNAAMALAEAEQRADLATSAMIQLGFLESNNGNLKGAVEVYKRVLVRGGDAHFYLGRTFYWLGCYTDAQSHIRQAIELVRDDPIKQIWPLQDLGLALVGTGLYTEADNLFDRSRQLCQEHDDRPLLARALANKAGFRLDVFDYAGNEALAEEARELARSVDFVVTVVSAGLDLMVNFARRGEVSRAEKMLVEVNPAVEKAGGSHGWLWRLRLEQARAELAYARGDWDETLRLAEISLQYSRASGRVKYQALGLNTRAQALIALGRTSEAIVELRNALELTRPTGDVAMFTRIAANLLAIAVDESLAREAHAKVQRIVAELPNDEMRRVFMAAAPVQQIIRLVR
ncbi:MAG TPA: hypothetical protein VGK87_12325, partial [Anaerolineae bacterium]